MATEAKKTTKATTRKAPAAKKAAAPAVTAEQAATAPARRFRELTGIVVSNKMQKTIIVQVDRRVRHGAYGKFMTYSEKYKAHDEKNTANVGDLVVMKESRPLSRDKRWVLTSVLRKAAQTADAAV